MKFTEEQTAQLRANMEKVRDYLVSRIPEMEEVGLEYVEVSFSDGTSYHDRCYVKVSTRGKVNGRVGDLDIYFDEKDRTGRVHTAAWGYSKYAISLMREWQLVKRRFDEQIQARRETNALIENFEI